MFFIRVCLCVADAAPQVLCWGFSEEQWENNESDKGPLSIPLSLFPFPSFHFFLSSYLHLSFLSPSFLFGPRSTSLVFSASCSVLLSLCSSLFSSLLSYFSLLFSPLFAIFLSQCSFIFLIRWRAWSFVPEPVALNRF